MKNLALLTAALISGCITIRAVQVDRKSTLEEQFIGEFEELTDDLTTVASVRAEANGLGLRGDDPYARALQARRLQLFYGDDLERLRARGCVGEALDGKLRRLDCDKPSEGAEPDVNRLLTQENQAREALVEYALSSNPNIQESERQQLWQAYRRIVMGQLKPGAMIENNAGKWVKK